MAGTGARQPALTVQNHCARLVWSDVTDAALHLAAGSRFASSAPAVVSKLLSMGASVATVNDAGLTPLAVACSNSDVSAGVVTALVEAGSSVTVTDDRGRSIVHMVSCSAATDLDLLAQLCSRGCGVNVMDQVRGERHDNKPTP